MRNYKTILVITDSIHKTTSRQLWTITFFFPIATLKIRAVLFYETSKDKAKENLRFPSHRQRFCWGHQWHHLQGPVIWFTQPFPHPMLSDTKEYKGISIQNYCLHFGITPDKTKPWRNTAEVQTMAQRYGGMCRGRGERALFDGQLTQFWIVLHGSLRTALPEHSAPRFDTEWILRTYMGFILQEKGKGMSHS